MNRPAGRVAWVNAAAGVAGDMLLAALVDAGADRLAIMQAWGALQLDGFAATWERVERGGVSALWTNIALHDHQHDDQPGDHPDDHPDDHRHDHRRAGDVIALIENSDMPDAVRADAVAVYRALAEVEGEIHGISADDVELHEVGALDSILDVVGVCAALDNLGVKRLAYSPIAVGHGSVTTAHGVLPNPVPAVVKLAARAQATLTGVDTTMELSTPTGVALLTVLGWCEPLPNSRISSQGYGAGTADPPGRANVVTVVIGDTVTEPAGEFGPSGYSPNEYGPSEYSTDQLVELTTNVDDTTGEVIAYTISQLLNAGALDAWAVPIVMKKGRPAHSVHALVDGTDVEATAACRETLFRELGTLGVRAAATIRHRVQRDEINVDVDGFSIRVKSSPWQNKAEHDDVATAAQQTGRSYRDIAAAAERLSDGRTEV